jgi:hypothetical protein
MLRLRESLDLIEFAVTEDVVDRRAVRDLVDGVRRTLLALKVDPDTVIEEIPQ